MTLGGPETARTVDAIGVDLPWPPPAGYSRFRRLLGTLDEAPCEQCGGAATLIWFMQLPATPLCQSCFLERGYANGDAATGVLAARDETGTWRPTSHPFDPRNPVHWREEPYDFDW